MSLTVSLAIAAAVVLLALLLHGWWTTRRAAPRRPAVALPEPVDRDAAGAGARIEPALDGARDPGAEADARAHADTLPPDQADAADAAARSTAAGGSGAPGGTADSPRSPHDRGADGPSLDALPTGLRAVPWRALRLDPLIDAIVPLALEQPVSGEAALAHLPPTRRVGGKPFYVEGLDTETGQFEALAPGRRYGELQAGVQLASRSGPLNQIEYSEFVHKVEAFAEAIGARAEPPDMLEVIARARELDGLASPLDAQLTVTLRTNAVAWSVAYVQQVAARHGFVPGAVPGRFVLPAAEEGAPPMLVLAVASQAALAALDDSGGDPAATAVRECTLSLDVPQTPASAEPFPAFHRAAEQLAEDLDATAIDDQGQPITLGAYAAIGQELERLYRGLEALDLAAGSPAARRLFS